MIKEGGGTKDIKKHLRKAGGAFFNLKKIWNTLSIDRNTKLKLLKTLVRPVLLYGCEARKLIAAEEKTLDRFQFTRPILRIFRSRLDFSCDRSVKITDCSW